MDDEHSHQKMNPIECDAILFDLDGVLIDSEACIERNWRAWARRYGLDWAEIKQLAHGRRTEETIRLVAPQLDAVEEARQFEAAEAGDTQGVRRIEAAAGLLESLPAEAWAIATSGTRAVATARLIHTGLPIPSVLVTAEDVTRGKPDPEPYLAAARGLGVTAEHCVVIEDAPAGIAAAYAAGMQAVAIASTHAPEDLAQASLIAGQLGEIQVQAGGKRRLVVSILIP